MAVWSLVHVLTEAILDYEDQLLVMTDRERERYAPMARQRARFLADRLVECEAVVPDVFYEAPPSQPVDNSTP